MGTTPYKIREVISHKVLLNSRNNAFYDIFMPLYHSLGFPNMILEGGILTPMTPPGSAPVRIDALPSKNQALCTCM